jgi:hypothetical protein
MTLPTAPHRGNTPGVVAPGDDTVSPLVAAFIGKRWESHYRAAWEKLGTADGVRSGSSWNWAAALFPIPWLAYRREWRAAIGVLLVAAFLTLTIPYGGVVTYVAAFIGTGLRGDRIVLGSAYTAAQNVLQGSEHSEQATPVAAPVSGTSFPGLLAFGVLSCVLFAGMLFEFVKPRFVDTVEKGYVTQMYADLDQLKDAEQAYFAGSNRYTDDLAALKFTPNAAVNRPVITVNAKGDGWSATISHPQVHWTCAIAVHMPNPFNTVADGVPLCRR